MEEALMLFQQGKFYLLGAFLIGLIVRVLKDEKFTIVKLQKEHRAALAFGLGVAASVLSAVAAGTQWPEAIATGLASAATAVGGHVVIIEWLRGGRELPIPGLSGKNDQPKPPDPPKPPPPPGANGSLPPGMATMALAFILAGCVTILGCGSPLENAVQVQHAGADAIRIGGEELQERCTNRLKPLLKVEDLEERAANAADIRKVCDPAREAYGSARAAHIRLSATIAALAGGVTVGELIKLTQETAMALAEVARTFARLREEQDQ